MRAPTAVNCTPLPPDNQAYDLVIGGAAEMLAGHHITEDWQIVQLIFSEGLPIWSAPCSE